MWGYSAKESGGKNAFGYEPKIYSDEPDARTSVRGSASNTGPLGTNNDWTWAYGSPTDIKRATLESKGSSRGGSSRGGGGSSSQSQSTVSNTTTSGTGSSIGQSNRTAETARNQTTTQRLRFTEEAPGTPTLPTLEMPKVDKRKIRAMAQQIAAPNIRRLNESVQTAMNVHADNPNVRRMTLREALQGYGSGLESTMAGASGQARQEHQQELSLASAEAQANWNANVQAMMQQYNNAWQKYLASAERVTETIGTDTSKAAETSSNQTTQQSTSAGTSNTNMTRSEEGLPPGGQMVVRRNVWGTPYLAPDFATAYRNRIPTSY